MIFLREIYNMQDLPIEGKIIVVSNGVTLNSCEAFCVEK